MTMPKKYRGRRQGYYTKEQGIKCTQDGFEHRYLCEGCIEEGHEQLPTSDALDCKIVFSKDGETIGQCQCYSKEHGMRNDDLGS